MSPQQERVLSRIKKMLNLANDAGASEGERDNALRMAYATMQKHNIDLATAEEHALKGGRPEDVKRERVDAHFVSHHWARIAAQAIAELFFCEYFYERNSYSGKVQHTFVGRADNAITAAEMAAYIAKSIQREATQWCGGDGGAQRDFCKGATTKIVRRVHAMRTQAETPAPAATPGVALVLKNFYAVEKAQNEKALVAIGVKFRKSRGQQGAKNDYAYSAGAVFGASVSLDRQLGGKS